MSRMKRHKIKTEKAVASTSHSREQEHDLAYYIHDRVELMHQVFSVLRHKELKAMAPECVRHISIDDLQELCTEELLGISSKRLCAVLDGAAPPSDTESSSRSPSPPLETISLDSISSDDEILSQTSKKKKHKHRRRDSKSKKKKSKDPEDCEDVEKSKASRAGLTVLELLELQARARAIRAQLQQEQAKAPTTAPTTDKVHSPSDNEVEIKEEPPDVVEISSDDEKPDLKELEKQTESQQARQVIRQPSPASDGKTITKRSDLIITVPQAKPSRKIKLNRSKVTVSVANVEKPPEVSKTVEVDKSKSKKKKKDKKKKIDKDGSDHDEITLQLSDSEKMDLLGSLEQKNSEAASTEDSESSSDSSEEEEGSKGESNEKSNKIGDTVIELTGNVTEIDTAKVTTEKENDRTIPTTVEHHTEPIIIDRKENANGELTVNEKDNSTQDANTDKGSEDITKENDKTDLDTTNNSSVDKEEVAKGQGTKEVLNISRVEDIPLIEDSREGNDNSNVSGIDCMPAKENTPTTSTKATLDKELSEGEVSDRDSSEVEAFEPPPEVVCISDEETKKKKKKKDKKAKKEKKSKKNKSDFREGADQNFYKKDNTDKKDNSEVIKDSGSDNCINLDDDACVILELSDDSSCYEVEGTVLSKEPTAEEIEALSARIDEIEREEVVTDDQIREHERMLQEKEQSTEVENVSWKDRYLDSTKVKRVLSTSNILNAMRKKNKELKKKLKESKEEDRAIEEKPIDEVVTDNLEEGTIDHYNTLLGSTKFVDPVEKGEAEKDLQKNIETEDGKVTKEMKKDAKQLLKMYKKLLKYNDMNKQKDPNKKKKKKKKSKNKNGEETT